MIRYTAKRVLLSLFTLWGLATVTFFALRVLVPGDPVALALGPRATPESIGRARHEAGLDQPLLAQYWKFLTHTARLDWGRSFTLNNDVGTIIGQRVMPSVYLISYGVLIAFAIGVPLAVVSAVRQDRASDHTIRFATTFLFGMPPFWLGLMIALLFGLKLEWFPVSGYESGLHGVLRTLTLPALTLGLSLMVIVTRTLRSNLIATLSSDYIENARARGTSEVRVIASLTMRNAIMPTLTLLAAIMGSVIGGTVVVESVFQIPGAGTLLVQAIFKRDYQLVSALTILAGGTVIVLALLMDLLQAALDPRVRLDG
ncbi:MAG: ABC transporter permease [Ilumatobacteraceae bacterium]